MVLVAGLALALPARADRPNARAADGVALDVPIDAIVTLAGRASAAAPALFTKQLAPGECR